MIVLNKRYSPNADKLPGYIYVGRPTQWGNPFKVGSTLVTDSRLEMVMTRELSLALYKVWARQQIEQNRNWLGPLREAKALICWCAPLGCHADVLATLLAEEREAILG